MVQKAKEVQGQDGGQEVWWCRIQISNINEQRDNKMQHDSQLQDISRYDEGSPQTKKGEIYCVQAHDIHQNSRLRRRKVFIKMLDSIRAKGEVIQVWGTVLFPETHRWNLRFPGRCLCSAPHPPNSSSSQHLERT